MVAVSGGILKPLRRLWRTVFDSLTEKQSTLATAGMRFYTTYGNLETGSLNRYCLTVFAITFSHSPNV